MLFTCTFEAGIQKLLFLGSSCIYPRDAAQPLVEEALLTGPLEPTNEPYAIAKIAGIKLCESYNRQYGTDYRSVMPANLYGPNDNFYSENSHVLPALMARFYEAVRDGAEEVVIWGSGTPRREFLHVDDLADARLVCAGCGGIGLSAKYPAHAQSRQCRKRGRSFDRRHLPEMLAQVTGFSGRISYDRSRPGRDAAEASRRVETRGHGVAVKHPLGGAQFQDPDGNRLQIREGREFPERSA